MLSATTETISNFPLFNTRGVCLICPVRIFFYRQFRCHPGVVIPDVKDQVNMLNDEFKGSVVFQV